MSRFERDPSQQIDSPDDAHRDAPAPLESSSDAEHSAAHIAALVRRTTERRATPGPSSVGHPDATRVQQPPLPTTAFVRPDAPRVAPPDAQPSGPTMRQPSGPSMRQPSRRVLVAAGAVVVLLIGGGVALSQTLGSDAPPPAAGLGKTSAPPAGYAVKLTDVITDCAEHSRGRTEDSFKDQNCLKATRLLATGQVGSRPVLFVVSRIEMASAEAAAGIKQVLDATGTGNLNDLLRDGKTFPGAPDKMPSSGYASVQTGKVVTVAEAGFIDGGRSASTDPSLRSAASEVAGMVSAQT